jgi:hypothetical protein
LCTGQYLLRHNVYVCIIYKKHFRWAKREAATYLRNTFEIVHTKFKNVDCFCAPGKGTEGHEYCRVQLTSLAFRENFRGNPFFVFSRELLPTIYVNEETFRANIRENEPKNCTSKSNGTFLCMT